MATSYNISVSAVVISGPDGNTPPSNIPNAYTGKLVGQADPEPLTRKEPATFLLVEDGHADHPGATRVGSRPTRER